MAASVVLLYRGTADTAAYVMLATGIPNYVFNTISGIRQWVSDWNVQTVRNENDLLEEKIRQMDLKAELEVRERDRRQAILASSELDLKEKKLQLAHDQADLDKKEVLKKEADLKHDEEQRIPRMRADVAETERKLEKINEERIDRIRDLKKERATHALDIKTKIETLKKLERENAEAEGKAHGDTKFKTQIKVFQELADEYGDPKLKKLLDDAEDNFNFALEAKKESKGKKLKAAAQKSYEEARTIYMDLQKEEVDMADKLAASSEELDEKTIKEIVEEVPGATPNKELLREMAFGGDFTGIPQRHGSDNGPRLARRHRSHNGPRLVKEKNTDCETEYCHRLWYSRHQPETGKRDTGDDASLYVIHDFHITPLDFDFHGDGTLQRRGDQNTTAVVGGVNATAINEDDTIRDEDCWLDVEDEEQKVQLHLRVVSQFGGDENSLDVLSMIGGKAFLQLWMNDVKKLPTIEIDGNKYSAWNKKGLSCWSFDTDGGDPAAWVAYTISKDSEYSSKSAKSLLDECKELAKG